MNEPHTEAESHPQSLDNTSSSGPSVTDSAPTLPSNPSMTLEQALQRLRESHADSSRNRAQMELQNMIAHELLNHLRHLHNLPRRNVNNNDTSGTSTDEEGRDDVRDSVSETSESEEDGRDNHRDTTTERRAAASSYPSLLERGLGSSLSNIFLGNETERGSSRSDREEATTENSSDPSEGTRIDLQSILRQVETSLPFLFLLFLLFIYEHLPGLLYFIWHTAVLYQINHIIKKQVSLNENRQLFVLLGCTCILTLHILFTYFYYQQYQLWRALLLLTPTSEKHSVWNVIWIIITNDMMVRFGVMIVKALTIAFVGHLPTNNKRKAQLYSTIEIASHVYRALLPVPVWFAYFTHHAYGYLFSNLIAGMYLTFKFTGVVNKFRQFYSIAKSFILQEVQFGKYASEEEVMEVGDLCAICQEKMKSPILLTCKHIFCEECVSEWFEREQTCPLCRSVIKSTGQKTHNDGTTSLDFQLF